MPRTYRSRVAKRPRAKRVVKRVAKRAPKSRAKGPKFLAKRRGRRANTKKSSSHSKRTSVTRSFQNKVERALGGEHQFVAEGHYRVGSATGSQYSGMAASQFFSVGDVETIYNFIWDIVQRIYYFPIGTSSGGFVAGAPLDFHLLETMLELQITNVQDIPVFGTLWRCVSRYDTTLDIEDAYNNSLGGMSTAKYTGPTDVQKNSSPFRYRDVCQNFKIMKPSKFKLEAGECKRFQFKKRWNRHIFNHLSGLSSTVGTEYFYFNLLGPPINDNTTKTTINTAQTQADITYQITYSFSSPPQPYRFRDIDADNVVVTTPAYMLVGSPASGTVIAA